VQTAIGDRSRLAYAEELADEKSVTAARFWVRAAAFFAAHGIERIAAVLPTTAPATGAAWIRNSCCRWANRSGSVAARSLDWVQSCSTL
jgi:hypothetical protein